MANEDDDLIRSLPQPPPPAPARRTAAIDEAMRRFDGEAPAPASAKPEPRRSGSWFGRPQMGILVAASLVAVIGLPVAWTTVSQKTEAPAEYAAHDIKTFDVAEEPPAAMVAPPPTVANTPTSGKQEPPSELAHADKARSADRPVEMAAMGEAAPAIHVEAPAAPAPAPAAVADSRMARSANVAELAQAAPPPAPPSAAMKMQAPDTAADRAGRAREDVIVTGARRVGKAGQRGDWNACTINDPARNLALCKSQVDPGAKGVAGVTAAHVADGLTQAWRGDQDAAIKAFDQAILVAPRSALAYLNRGLAYQRQGDLARARADLDKAVRYAPRAARGYFARSQILRQQGEERRARADEDSAVELDSRYEDVLP